MPNPGDSIRIYINGLATGLVGTLAISILSADDESALLGATTGGVAQSTATGRYYANPQIPAGASGNYFARWTNTGLAEDPVDDTQIINITPLPQALVPGVAYATLCHVQALNAARPITASSRPSASQVAGFLVETAAVIDAILSGRGFTLPIPTTATAALKLLEGYNAKLAWPLVERAAPVSTQADAADKAAQYAEKMLMSLEPPQVPRDPATTRAIGSGTGSTVFSRDMML